VRQLYRRRCLPFTHCCDQGFGFGGWLGLEVDTQALGEIIVRRDSAGAIAQSIEQGDEPPHQVFVMACKSRRPASMLSRRGYVTRCFALLDERARGPRHSFTQPRALALQPALEVARP